MKYFLSFLSTFILAFSCSTTYTLPATEDHYFDDAYICYSPEDRIGAFCKDSTYSKSTGSGACSHHGGVLVWLCK